MRRLALAAAGLAWLAFWFWAFSLAWSDGFFLDHRHARLPILAASLLCVAVLPLSALGQWRRVAHQGRSAPRALVDHGLASLAALVPPFALTFALSRASGRWRLEADDAMGVGIDNLVLLLLAVATALVLGVALAVRAARRRPCGEAGSPR